MFDLTNIYFKYIGGYYTEALLYKQMDLTTLVRTFPRNNDFSHGLTHTTKRKSYIYYFKVEQCKNKVYDLHINIVQSKTNTFVILSANHEKIDGCFLHKIIYLWSSNYIQKVSLVQNSYITNVVKTIDKTNFLPIKIKFIDEIKTKYKISSYLACVSIWSLYFFRFEISTRVS